MISMKRILISASVAALMGVGALASAGSASAEVVCNNAGDCWHTDKHYRYDSNLGVQRHRDDWYFHQRWNDDRDHHYRDYHEGRGGYRNGIWFSF
ncbi:MAG: hypothetical protein ABI963_03715 [Rhizomicrobium sp.]